MQVAKGHEGWYLIVAGSIFIPALMIILGREVWGNDGDDFYTTFENIGRSLAPWMILAFGNSLLLVEGVTMLSERYLKRRYEEGRQEANRKWEEWNKRREEAARNNQDFNEPPPSENGQSGK